MSDQTAAANLEITSALAEAAEDILRDFAENAELDVALVVDHSGGLIAGISADDDVNVTTVGALVAGTVGSIRALGKAVGETKALESMHHGEGHTIYLRELNERFIIVGTAESGLPAGIIREVGSRISKPLLAVLLGEEIVEKTGDDTVDFDDEIEGDGPSSEDQEESDISEEPKVVVPPLVVDSPFEFVDEDEFDEEANADAAEEEEEGIAADGVIFEIGVDEDSEPEADSAVDSEVPVTQEIEEESQPEVIFELSDDEDQGGDSPDFDDQLNDEEAFDAEGSEKEELIDDESVVGGTEDAEEAVFELGGDEDGGDEDDDTGVSAPLLVSPMMPVPEPVKIKIEDDSTTSVAAITTPIATDIVKKSEISAPSLEDATPTAADSPETDAVVEDGDDSEDDDKPVGGPRYVFEIG